VSASPYSQRGRKGEILLPESDQDLLHGVVSAPLGDASELGEIDTSVLVDAGQVDLGGEFNEGGLIRVTGAAVNLQVVYAVLVNTLEKHAGGKVQLFDQTRASQ